MVPWISWLQLYFVWGLSCLHWPTRRWVRLTIPLVPLHASNSKQLTLKGILFISCALCADAVIGNVQEKAMKAHGGTNTEMVGDAFFLVFKLR